MTKNEALQLINKFPMYDCYSGGERLDKVSDFNYEELFDYFLNLSVPFDIALKFLDGDIDFATIDNERTNDDHDYLNWLKGKDDKYHLYSWTEVCGNMYCLDDYNITWKEYTPSKEEIEERERREKERQEKCKCEWEKIVNNISKTTGNLFPNVEISEYYLK